jgi:glycosyltransferase involved in cell wall biosynthesis
VPTTHDIDPDPTATSSEPLFTVFTPTSDRAHTLERVHDSLCAQTFGDFEWLVVDDGSTDGTDHLVARWSEEASFPVRYVWQENVGKHVAFNRAVQAARGTLFLTLDSDDECVPTALERFADHWWSIPSQRRDEFSAVTALCANADGKVVGAEFPHDPTDSDPIEIEYRYGVDGEKWGFHRTDVLARYPFPEVPGQPFVTESLVWHRIAHDYRTRYVNDVLRVYRRESGTASLTDLAGRTADRAPMFALRDHMILTEEIGWFRHAPRRFLRAAANYTRFSRHEGRGFAQQRRALRPLTSRLLHAVAAPLGVALWWRDRRGARS